MKNTSNTIMTTKQTDRMATIVAGLLASGDYTYFCGMSDKVHFVTDGHKKQVMTHAKEIIRDIDLLQLENL